MQRLEQAFEQLDKTAKGKTCKAMKGLIEEGGEVIEEDSEEPINDLALIAAAQRVEHYEISAYGTAKAMANHLGEDEVASLLEETEDEEKAADKKLTEIAMGLMQDAKSSRKWSWVGRRRRGNRQSAGHPKKPRRLQRRTACARNASSDIVRGRAETSGPFLPAGHTLVNFSNQAAQAS